MLSELENFRLRLDDLHRQMTDLLSALPAEALNWRPLEAGDEHVTNSLAVLATHSAGAERYWIGEVIGGLPATRNRDAEFTVQVSAVAALVETLEGAARESAAVLQKLTDADLDGERTVQGRTVCVRWGLLHVIDHTALHLGHMQMTYQLWANGKTARSPHWHERLPTGPSRPNEAGD
jgi:uncharacterized damage-inducible protein DinB